MRVSDSCGVSSRVLFFILFVFFRSPEDSLFRESGLCCYILNFTKPPKFRYIYNISNKKQHKNRLYDLTFTEDTFKIKHWI